MPSLGDVLACPDCRAPIEGDECELCRRAFPIVNGVRTMLPANVNGDTRTFYEQSDAVRYGSAAMPEAISQRVGQFLESLASDALVVELGSGRCVFGHRYPGVVLGDYSLYALRQFGEGQRLQLDAQALPFRDASVDAFFSIAMIEHVPRPESVLTEIDRCLAPGGAALLYPAWFVFPWASRDLARRPYRQLGFRDKLAKGLIPLRRHRVYRFLRALPGRLMRELQLTSGQPLPFRYRSLEPNLDQYLTSDSDAFTSMDPHACAVFFLSRGYVVPEARTRLKRLWLRYVPIEVWKPT